MLSWWDDTQFDYEPVNSTYSVDIAIKKFDNTPVEN